MSLIYVTRAMQDDIPAIGAIFEQAKAFLKASGSPLAGYAAAIIGDDPNYQEIDGAWQNNTEPGLSRTTFSQIFYEQFDFNLK